MYDPIFLWKLLRTLDDAAFQEVVQYKDVQHTLWELCHKEFPDTVDTLKKKSKYRVDQFQTGQILDTLIGRRMIRYSYVVNGFFLERNVPIPSEQKNNNARLDKEEQSKVDTKSVTKWKEKQPILVDGAVYQKTFLKAELRAIERYQLGFKNETEQILRIVYAYLVPRNTSSPQNLVCTFWKLVCKLQIARWGGNGNQEGSEDIESSAFAQEQLHFLIECGVLVKTSETKVACSSLLHLVQGTELVACPKLTLTTNLKIYMDTSQVTASTPYWNKLISSFAHIEAVLTNMTIADIGCGIKQDLFENTSREIQDQFADSVVQWIMTNSEEKEVPLIIQDSIYASVRDTQYNNQVIPNKIEIETKEKKGPLLLYMTADNTLEIVFFRKRLSEQPHIANCLSKLLNTIGRTASQTTNVERFTIDKFTLLAASLTTTMGATGEMHCDPDAMEEDRPRAPSNPFHNKPMSSESILATLDTYAANTITDSMKQFVQNRFPNPSNKATIEVSRNGVKADVSSNSEDTIKRLYFMHYGSNMLIANQSLSFAIPLGQTTQFKKDASEQLLAVQEIYNFNKGDPRLCDTKEQLQKGSVTFRDYQIEAIDAIVPQKGPARSGIIVLPCGAGKTMVGIGCIAQMRTSTLILVPQNTIMDQWEASLKRFTNISDSELVVFKSNGRKSISKIPPVCVCLATYGMLTFIPTQNAQDQSTLKEQIRTMIREKVWGLTIIDEVHQAAANDMDNLLTELKSHIKVGLSATLVREDNKKVNLNFSVGPKLFEKDRNTLTREGKLEECVCLKINCYFPPAFAEAYTKLLHNKEKANQTEVEPTEDKTRIDRQLYNLNPTKFHALARIVEKHSNLQILILGDSIIPLREYRKALSTHMKTNYMMIMGGASASNRPSQENNNKFIVSSGTELSSTTLADFRQNKTNVLFISKVGDQGIDIPAANVLIQVSMQEGSRRQEAQRIGRLMRKSESGQPAFFYSLVTPGTKETEYYAKRMKYAMDLGYMYRDIDVSEIVDSEEAEKMETDFKDTFENWLEKAQQSTKKTTQQSTKKTNISDGKSKKRGKETTTTSVPKKQKQKLFFKTHLQAYTSRKQNLGSLQVQFLKRMASSRYKKS